MMVFISFTVEGTVCPSPTTARKHVTCCSFRFLAEQAERRQPQEPEQTTQGEQLILRIQNCDVSDRIPMLSLTASFRDRRSRLQLPLPLRYLLLPLCQLQSLNHHHLKPLVYFFFFFLIS
jgi:hypothetical protein